jgi:hypothetical protein
MNDRTRRRRATARAMASDAAARASGAVSSPTVARSSGTTPEVAFRVMRLRAPSYEHAGGRSVGAVTLERGDFDADARRDGSDDARRVDGGVGAGAGAASRPATSGNRHQPAYGDARATRGELVLPQSFGAVALGERFSSFVVFGNFTRESGTQGGTVREIGIKIELQTERQRATLYDGTKTPIACLRPGEKADVIVTKDLKELGAHTLVCSATYYDESGERKYLPQYFKFKVSNPLSVRTKVRAAPRGRVFLEACIENVTRYPLLLHKARFEATSGLVATEITPERGGESARFDETSDAGKGLPSLGARAVYQLDALNGSAHFLFEIARESGGDDPFTPQTPLGKLELFWRGAMGDPGRLQTQVIAAGSAGSSDRVPDVVKMRQSLVVDPSPSNAVDASTVYVERPFSLRVVVEALAPVAAGEYVLRVKDVVTGVYLDGARTVHVGALARGDTEIIDLSCVALGLGAQTCPSLALVGVEDDAVAHAPPPLDIFVVRDLPRTTARGADALVTVDEPPSAMA